MGMHTVYVWGVLYLVVSKLGTAGFYMILAHKRLKRTQFLTTKRVVQEGLTPKIRMLHFVIINGFLFNPLCFWILFYTASRHSCFNFFGFYMTGAGSLTITLLGGFVHLRVLLTLITS